MLYSYDFRKKVLSFLEKGDNKSEVCRRFSISRNTLDGWLKLKRERGSIRRLPLNRKFRKIDPEILKARVELDPNASLKEHAQFFSVGISSIYYVFQRLGITRKKRFRVIKKEMKTDGLPF